MTALEIATPRWGVPFLGPAPYKAVKGGRASGKSHFLCENAIERSLMDVTLSVVCIREVQKSLQFSSKRLLENKIRAFKAENHFDIQNNCIRRRNRSGGSGGYFIFQGMQDHTADSIKSLEDFRVGIVDEANRLSALSLRLLRPTIMRGKGAELWFGWNPDQPTDPVDAFFAENPPEGAVIAHVNYDQNPFLSDELRAEIAHDRKGDPDMFAHVWEGAYNVKNHAQILNGKWEVAEFDTPADAEFLFGADWGFSVDPTVLLRLFIKDNCLWIDQELFKVGLELDQTGPAFKSIPGADKHRIRADCSRPETISYVKRTANLDVIAAEKWQGSVEDGIAYLRKFQRIYIHERCKRTAQEARLWSYKTHRLTGDVLPEVADGNDHTWDAARYALSPLIRKSGGGFVTI